MQFYKTIFLKLNCGYMTYTNVSIFDNNRTKEMEKIVLKKVINTKW